MNPAILEALQESGARRALPIIQVSGAEPRALIDETMAAIIQRNNDEALPTIFAFGGRLARLARHRNGVAIDTLTPDSFRRELVDTARFQRLKPTKDDSDSAVPIQPPQDLARLILAQTAWPRLPAVRGVTAVPVFTAGGRLLVDEGFDEESGLLCVPDRAVRGMRVPEQPSEDDIRWARERLDDLLGDLPFADDEGASRAHAMALALQSFGRELIDGPTPLYLVNAPLPGSGKTLLVRLVTTIALGHDAPMMAEGRDDSEWRKRITAMLRNQSSFHVMDNVRRTLDSGPLALALTTPVWEDRILGQSATVTLPVRGTWVATGNFLQTSDEIGRRSVLIDLRPKEDRPSDRSNFRHANVVAWTRTHRAELVKACLVLWQAWLATGRPKVSTGSSPPFGSFEAWQEVMAGVLATAGVDGFLGNRQAMRTVVEASGWDTFFQAWWDRHRNTPVTAGELVELARVPLNEYLVGRTPQGEAARLGHLLQTRAGRIGAFILMEAGISHRRSVLWRLEQSPNAPT